MRCYRSYSVRAPVRRLSWGHRLSGWNCADDATLAAVIMAAVLCLSLGLYYTALASSLSSTLDYSVSMDTWLQFPLQSANQRLKTSWRSMALLRRFYPSGRCFIIVSSSSILRRTTDSIFFILVFEGRASPVSFHHPALHCHTVSVRGAGGTRRTRGVFLWRKLRLKSPSGVFSSGRKLCVKRRRCRCPQRSKTNTFLAPLV